MGKNYQQFYKASTFKNFYSHQLLFCSIYYAKLK